jgi:hypothetical protein
MKQQTFYNVAIYCRLSKDDDLHGESSSISTQKKLLTLYVAVNNWRVAGCYIDDGISGPIELYMGGGYAKNGYFSDQAPYYGDDPNDHDMIKKGIDWFNSSYPGSVNRTNWRDM